MRAGKLRETLTIQQEVITDDGQGGLVSSWQNVGTVFAEVTSLSGIEALRQSSIERSIVQYKVRIRRRDDVTATSRLRWQMGATSVLLEVKAAMPDPLEPHAVTMLLCEAGISNSATGTPPASSPALKFNDAGNSEYLSVIAA